MTDPDWQARALEVAMGNTANVKLLRDRILAFAKEYAAEVTAEVGRLNVLIERLKQEAQIHAQEAATQHATVQEIYQLCTGGKGEPGNWNGAEPVRALIADLRAQLAAAGPVWQPIETAPKDGREILGYREDAGVFLMAWTNVETIAEAVADLTSFGEDELLECFWCGAGLWKGFRLEGQEAPTHWMPKPAPSDLTGEQRNG